jgi:hypothetical protein
MSDTIMVRANNRLSFSEVQPKLQIAWDSVSLGALKKCPRYYQYAIVEGWRGKHESHHLRYGQLYHRALEVYDHHSFTGASHEEALVAALRDLADGCQDWELVTKQDDTRIVTEPERLTNPDPVTGEVYRRVGWWNPHEHLHEEKAKRDAKDIPNLFRTVIWYLDTFGQQDTLKTVRLANGKPAVEMSFRYELGYTFETGEEMLHSGHLDRVVRMGEEGSFYVLDRKTTGTTISGNSAWGYFAKYSPDNQMTGYTLAARVVLGFITDGVIIDAAQIAKGFSRFERGITTRTEGQLEEWRQDVFYWVRQAEMFAKAQYWPMNDRSCDEYGGCPFRGVCSKDPAVRYVYLQSDFKQQKWDPLKTRGDI